MRKEVQNLPEIKSNNSWRIPIEAIIELKEKNLSHSEIAKLLGCCPSNISQRMKDIDYTTHFVNARPKVLAYWQMKIFNSITDADLKKANLRDKIISAGVLYDKERLESGKSTQILGYADAIKSRDGVKITLEEIRRVRIERTTQKVSSLDSQPVMEIPIYQGFAGGGKNEPLGISIQDAEIIQDTSL